MNIWLALPFCYLLGSIPTAVWVSRVFGGIDIREHGSKNAGLTNVYRVLGWKPALPVALVDFSKGLAAVLVGYYLTRHFWGKPNETVALVWRRSSGIPSRCSPGFAAARECSRPWVCSWGSRPFPLSSRSPPG